MSPPRLRLSRRGWCTVLLGLGLGALGEADAVPALVGLGAAALVLVASSALVLGTGRLGPHRRRGAPVLRASPLPSVASIGQPLTLSWQAPWPPASSGAGTLATEHPFARSPSRRRWVALRLDPGGGLHLVLPPSAPRPEHRGLLSLPGRQLLVLDPLGLVARPLGWLEPLRIPVLPPPTVLPAPLDDLVQGTGPPEPPDEPGLHRADQVVSPARVHWPASLRTGTLLLRLGPPVPAQHRPGVVDLAELAALVPPARADPSGRGARRRAAPPDPLGPAVALAFGLVLEHLRTARPLVLRAPSAPAISLDPADPLAALQAATWLARLPPVPSGPPLAP